mmetsp:Transcript_9208/g.15682  ORF Transcript_9208/g.15682 Transcript_9208/m.15682 type:complete len:103 (-) Transcript_9208:997-1305(-)
MTVVAWRTVLRSSDVIWLSLAFSEDISGAKAAQTDIELAIKPSGKNSESRILCTVAEFAHIDAMKCRNDDRGFKKWMMEFSEPPLFNSTNVDTARLCDASKR